MVTEYAPGSGPVITSQQSAAQCQNTRMTTRAGLGWAGLGWAGWRQAIDTNPNSDYSNCVAGHHILAQRLISEGKLLESAQIL